MANYQYCNFPVECADYFCNSVTYLYKEQTEKENYVGVIVTVNYLPLHIHFFFLKTESGQNRSSQLNILRLKLTVCLFEVSLVAGQV